MVDDETLDRQALFFHIKGGQDGAVDGPQASRADDERWDVQPADEIFQLEADGIIFAEGTDDATAAFDRDVGIGCRDALPVAEDDAFFDGLLFPAGCQVRRHGVVVKIRQEQVRRFANPGYLIYITGITGRDGRGAADGSLIITDVITVLAQCLDEQGCDIGLADVRPRPGDE